MSPGLCTGHVCLLGDATDDDYIHTDCIVRMMVWAGVMGL